MIDYRATIKNDIKMITILKKKAVLCKNQNSYMKRT